MEPQNQKNRESLELQEEVGIILSSYSGRTNNEVI